MTFRAKPAGRRRPGWESDSRRNFYLNVGFGLVVVGAVVILGVAAAAFWYGEHLEPVGSVNGASITKDDFRARAEVELFRLETAGRRIDDEWAAGRIDQATRDSQHQVIDQRRQSLDLIVLEQIIDSRIQATLAAQEGITVTEAEIDAALAKEATTIEQRRVWAIEVEPELDDDATDPTPAQVAAAKAKAEQALADLEAGKTWEEVATTYSTSIIATTEGDLGYQYREGSLDEPFAEAVFALEDEAHTEVIEGDDGVFRIGRVTEIIAPREDPNHAISIQNEGVSMAAYRDVLRSEETRRKLEEKIREQALVAGPQRRVAEILIPAPNPQSEGNPPPADAIRVRHILFSPKDDPDGARDLAADDPAWQAAEDEARDAYDRIEADPDVFDEIAREDTDDIASADTGGKQPYYSSLSSIDPAFAAAILDPTVQPGQLLEPVKGAAGWHVIQVMHRWPDIDRGRAIKTALDEGADFAEYARSDSYGPEAADGGELGWIARFQIDTTLEEAIFATAVGEISDPVEADDGVHIYQVLEEQERELDDEQRTAIEDGAFNNWYLAKKETFDIHRIGEDEEEAAA
jgi:parvulin-like peptidyl-prolyl isomerase